MYMSNLKVCNTILDYWIAFNGLIFFMFLNLCPVPEPNVGAIQEFDVYTDEALLTIDNQVDYEVAQEYLLIISVQDDNASPRLSGEVAVQVSLLYLLSSTSVFFTYPWYLMYLSSKYTSQCILHVPNVLPR